MADFHPAGLIHKAMKDCGVDRFLIDGFPRALDQAEAFERMVCESNAMLFLDCPEHVMEQRLLGRGEGRSDDNPETIKKRFRVYTEQTMPVIEKYESLGKLRKVSADRSPDEVFADVSAIVEAIEGAPLVSGAAWDCGRGFWGGAWRGPGQAATRACVQATRRRLGRLRSNRRQRQSPSQPPMTFWATSPAARTRRPLRRHKSPPPAPRSRHGRRRCQARRRRRSPRPRLLRSPPSRRP